MTSFDLQILLQCDGRQNCPSRTVPTIHFAYWWEVEPQPPSCPDSFPQFEDFARNPSHPHSLPAHFQLGRSVEEDRLSDLHAGLHRGQLPHPSRRTHPPAQVQVGWRRTQAWCWGSRVGVGSNCNLAGRGGHGAHGGRHVGQLALGRRWGHLHLCVRDFDWFSRCACLIFRFYSTAVTTVTVLTSKMVQVWFYV